MDRDGNIIKSYRPDVKKWIPLNRDANVDQWQHIQEIVNACGLDFNHETDVISLPSLNSNYYFKGGSIVDAINNGDSAVKSQVTRLDGRIDDTNNRVQAHKDEVDGKLTTINTNISNINNRVNTLEDQVDDIITGGGGSTGGDYENLGVINTNSSWLVNIAKTNGVRGELYSSNTSSFTGSDTIYWCDYQYMSSSSTIRTFLIGGSSDDGSGAGLFRLGCVNGLGTSYADVGSRLTYLI